MCAGWERKRSSSFILPLLSPPLTGWQALTLGFKALSDFRCSVLIVSAQGLTPDSNGAIGVGETLPKGMDLQLLSLAHSLLTALEVRAGAVKHTCQHWILPGIWSQTRKRVGERLKELGNKIKGTSVYCWRSSISCTSYSGSYGAKPNPSYGHPSIIHTATLFRWLSKSQRYWSDRGIAYACSLLGLSNPAAWFSLFL